MIINIIVRVALSAGWCSSFTLASCDWSIKCIWSYKLILNVTLYHTYHHIEYTYKLLLRELRNLDTYRCGYGTLRHHRTQSKQYYYKSCKWRFVKNVMLSFQSLSAYFSYRLINQYTNKCLFPGGNKNSTIVRLKINVIFNKPRTKI